METCPPNPVLIANSPTGRDFLDERRKTPCPKFPEDESKSHCKCSANYHSCGFCDAEW